MCSTLPSFRRQFEALPFTYPAVATWAAPLLELSDGLTRCATHGPYGPATTFFLYLAQAMGPDKTCQAAVAPFVARHAERGRRVSPNTAAYCKARDRLTLADLQTVNRRLSARLEAQAGQGDRWSGRRVRIVDGSTLDLLDTPDNQRAYPQPAGQKPGCGFPQMRVLVAFDLASGALRHLAHGPLAQGEHTLLRTLWEAFARHDVLVADQGFCAYALLCEGLEHGLDWVVRKKGARLGARLVEQLGPNDRLVAWPKKNSRRPAGMTPEQWQALPAELQVREVTVEVDDPASRVDRLTVVTTLVDAEAYPATALADLYRRRTQGELHLNTLKTTLKLELLRCKTPERAAKELAMYTIGHNLVRAAMQEAAQKHGVEVERLSFTGCARLANAFAQVARGRPEADQARLYEALLDAMVRHKLPRRPQRREPRALKRRPKNYPRLTQSRHEFQETPHRGKKRAAQEES